MKIQSSSRINCSFGFKKATTVRDVFERITNPIKSASSDEKILLRKALGLSSEVSKNWQSKFESHGKDIIGGEILPNITVTTSGVFLTETIGNIINVELARIRGQLKKIQTEDFKL